MDINVLNLSVLRRIDPSIALLLRVSSYVTVYTHEDNSWRKKDVEGAFFVVKRVCAPEYSLFVLNRLSMDNFAQYLTPNIRVQMVQPFLMLYNGPVVHGIFFHTPVDVGPVLDLICSLLSRNHERHLASTTLLSPPAVTTASAPVDYSTNESSRNLLASGVTSGGIIEAPGPALLSPEAFM